MIAGISAEVTRRTLGTKTRPIRVTDDVIVNVLDSFLFHHRPMVGDMYSRFNIPGDGDFSGDFSGSGNRPGFAGSHYISEQVVEFMVEYLKTEYGINANNNNFSIHSTLYGANDYGLRSHSQIKTRLRRPIPFQFHMKF
jgi:hypothetical protein